MTLAFKFNLEASARIFLNNVFIIKVVCAVEVSYKKMLELWDI